MLLELQRMWPQLAPVRRLIASTVLKCCKYERYGLDIQSSYNQADPE